MGMYEETETKGSGGALLVGLVVLIGLVVVGLIALGPVTSNLAEVQAQKSAAVQAEAASRTAIAEAREATAREEARLRTEQTAQIAGYLVLVVGGGIVCILIGGMIGSLLYGLEWAADRRQARLLLLLEAQRQAAYVATPQPGILQLPEIAERAVILPRGIADPYRER